MELLVAGIPALLYAAFIGSMARRRERPLAPWAAVTLVAALVFLLGSIAIPSQSPGTVRIVTCIVTISGFVWCALAPIFVCVRVRERTGT